MFNSYIDDDLRKNLKQNGIIMPDEIFKHYAVTCVELYNGPRVHYFHKVKIIFNRGDLLVTIKSTRKNSMFLLKYFLVFLNSVDIDLINNIAYSNKIIFNNVDLKIFNRNAVINNLIKSYLNYIVNTKENVVLVEITFFKNEEGFKDFLYFNNLLVTADHDMLPDHENFIKESGRWDLVELNQQYETDSDVSD